MNCGHFVDFNSAFHKVPAGTHWKNLNGNEIHQNLWLIFNKTLLNISQVV